MRRPKKQPRDPRRRRVFVVVADSGHAFVKTARERCCDSIDAYTDGLIGPSVTWPEARKRFGVRCVRYHLIPEDTATGRPENEP